MNFLKILLLLVLAHVCVNINCNPVEMEAETTKVTATIDSNSQETQTKSPIKITMTTVPEVGVADKIQVPQETTTIQPEIRNEDNNEKTVQSGKCSGNGNQTQNNRGNERIIPFPLCKPIQGRFYTGLCSAVCGLPLKSKENPCRFSEEDKIVFCDCGGAEEGETAACGPGLERQTLCHFPELNPTARVCRAICRKLGKSYDFCTSPSHARRSFCSCFDASRTQRKGNGIEIEDVSLSEKIQEEIPAPVPAPVPDPASMIKSLASSQVVATHEGTEYDDVDDVDDNDDVDVDDVEEESCDDDNQNQTAIQNLRQKNTGSCHPVLSAYVIKICNGICGGTSRKTCRVNKQYKKVYCDCPGNEVKSEAFCGPHAEMFNHCFAERVPNQTACQSICSEIGKRSEICLNPQNSQTLAMCSCFTG